MAKSAGAASKTRSRSAKSKPSRAAGTGQARVRGTQTAAAPDDIGHDVLHGPAKSAIYAAMTKRLRSNA